MTSAVSSDDTVEIARLSQVGTERDHNEDACGSLCESSTRLVAIVADGVSSSRGGEVASQMAVDVTLRAFAESPVSVAVGARLYRAVQQANIEIYDRSIAVPELSGMATTLTAIAVDGAELTAIHVGDSRLYLLSGDTMIQLTKDHTVAAEKSRLGLLSKERARTHADRCVLTRCVGRELIVARDRTTRHLTHGDTLVLCSDGLYNVLTDSEIARIVAGHDAAENCHRLIETANNKDTPDNLTAVVARVLTTTTSTQPRHTLASRLRHWVSAVVASNAGARPTLT